MIDRVLRTSHTVSAGIASVKEIRTRQRFGDWTIPPRQCGCLLSGGKSYYTALEI